MKNKVAAISSFLLVFAFLAPHCFCEEEKKKTVNNPAFHKQLLEIAAKYESYGKVDDMSRWAPALCAAPPAPKLRKSAAGKGPHERKLYYLFAADRSEYVEGKAPKVGQTVVKEAWVPQSAIESPHNFNPKGSYRNALFIMTKLDPKTKDTDQGWVYGTVTADGKTVTSSGRVESCMGCHIQTKNDRLFGMKNPSLLRSDRSAQPN